MVICALGDLLLDVIVRLRGEIVTGDDTPVVTHVGAGGQAANVAAWATSLGATARLICKRGSDRAGEMVAAELRDRGVELLGPVGPGSTGTVVSLVDTQGERSLLTHRGVAAELRADEIDSEWLAGCDVLHISGYALTKAGVRAGGMLSVDLGARTTIDDELRRRVRELRPEIVFATEQELAAFGDLETETLVVKRGALGVVVIRDGAREEHPAPLVEIVDSTGAGDALAAGFLVGGLDVGLDAAARCVLRLGAMP